MTEWSVSAAIDHALGITRAGSLLEKVLGHLTLYSAAGSCTADSLSVRLSVEARTPEAAVAAAVRLFKAALRRVGFPGAPTVIAIEAETAEYFQRRLEAPNSPEIVGVAEVAGILGVSRQRVSELAGTPDFPRPLVTLASGPVWLRSSISRFVRQWPRRPGRPRKTVVAPRASGD